MHFIIEELSDDMGERFIEAKEEFVASISRGGLSGPSDYIYIASVHASCLHNFIFNDENLRNALLCTHNIYGNFYVYDSKKMTTIQPHFFR